MNFHHEANFISVNSEILSLNENIIARLNCKQILTFPLNEKILAL